MKPQCLYKYLTANLFELNFSSVLRSLASIILPGKKSLLLEPIPFDVFFPLISDDAGGAPARSVPRPGADEEVAGDSTLRLPPRPVRRRTGGREYGGAPAEDPGGADGGDQLRGAGGVGGVGEALLPGVRLRRVRPRRRAAAAAHEHQAKPRHRRRGAGARQRAGVGRRGAAPPSAGGGVHSAPRFLMIESVFYFLRQCVRCT